MPRSSSTDNDVLMYTFGKKDYVILRTLRLCIVMALLIMFGGMIWFVQNQVFSPLEHSFDMVLIRQTPDIGTLNTKTLQSIMATHEQKSFFRTSTIPDPFTVNENDDSVPELPITDSPAIETTI